MAPLSPEVTPINCAAPTHFGPPIPEASTAWFRLFVYDLLGMGPTSVLLTKGTRVRNENVVKRTTTLSQVRRLPRELQASKARDLLLCTWTHEPGIVLTDACLMTLNDTLLSNSMLLQVAF